jgi:hypothetical protein
MAVNGLQLTRLRFLSAQGAQGLDRESVEYYRARARAEREAALNATSAKARQAHGELARAYARLVEVAELEQEPASSIATR